MYYVILTLALVSDDPVATPSLGSASKDGEQNKKGGEVGYLMLYAIASSSSDDNYKHQPHVTVPSELGSNESHNCDKHT